MEKKRWFSSRLLLIILLLGGALQVQSQVKTENFRYLTRLNGTWHMKTRASVIVEQWQRLNDSTFEGHTWRVVNNDSALQETMQVVRKIDGIYFISNVVGQNNGQAVGFKLSVLKPEGFIAENPAHDFPQKITYRFKDETHLHARIEGYQNKVFGEVIFQYVKQ